MMWAEVGSNIKIYRIIRQKNEKLNLDFAKF